MKPEQFQFYHFWDYLFMLTYIGGYLLQVFWFRLIFNGAKKILFGGKGKSAEKSD